MLRFSLLTILLCLLAFTFLNAQTVSVIEFRQGLALTQDYDYVTTWSDSLLHFYRLDNDAYSFYLKHWTCSPSGLLTAPENIYTYTGTIDWSAAFPGYWIDWLQQYGRIYLSFTVQSSFHFLSITGSGIVQHDILPSSGFYEYYLFTPDNLFYSVWHDDNPNFWSIHRYNLNTDNSDSLFTWNGYTHPMLNVLGERFLLISDMFSGGQTNSILIDTLQISHPGIVTGAGGIYRINLESSEILPDTYFAGIQDGTLRDYSFGVLSVNGFNLHYTGIGSILNMGGGIVGQFFNDVIPYGNGRFSCTEGLHDFGNLVFRNYTYNALSFTEDNDFPNLSNFSNAYSLQKINDRYAVGIAGSTLGPRQFICIDYQYQSVMDSVYTFSYAPNINYGDLHADNDNLFYVYKSSQGMHLYILKIVDYTANNDPVQPPQILAASAWPNPFTEHATIKVSLKQPEPLTISIYNLKGQLVRNLSKPGKAELTHELDWNGKTDTGNNSVPGIYIYKASTQSGNSISGKIILLK